MTDRRHVARLAAKDVEHADPIFARGHMGQRTGTDEILEIAYTLLVHDSLLMRGGQASGGLAGRYAEPGRYLLATAGLHPCIDLPGVQHDLAHVRVEPEEAIGQSERIERVAHGAHAAHKVRAAAADHHVQRRGSMPAEVLAQRIGHRAEGLEDVSIVRLSADDEQHVALLDPVFEADTCYLFHFFVRRVAAEV